MTFTDDDLKLLKEQLKEHEGHSFPCPCTFNNSEMSGLLSRLEAAERLFDFFCVCEAIVGCKEAEEKFEIWRKSAGL